jgi:hypothetical protein
MLLPDIDKLSELDKKKLCDLKTFLEKYIENITYEIRNKPL